MFSLEGCSQDSIGFPLGKMQSYCKILRIGMISLFQWHVSITNSLTKKIAQRTQFLPGVKAEKSENNLQELRVSFNEPLFLSYELTWGPVQGADESNSHVATTGSCAPSAMPTLLTGP